MTYQHVIKAVESFGMPAKCLLIVDLFLLLPKERQLDVMADIVRALKYENSSNEKIIGLVASTTGLERD